MNAISTSLEGAQLEQEGRLELRAIGPNNKPGRHSTEAYRRGCLAMRWPGTPSGLKEGEMTPIVVRNHPSEGGRSPQGNGGRDDGARFEGWTRAATLQSDHWARAERARNSNR
jgi:hypothetical protein